MKHTPTDFDDDDPLFDDLDKLTFEDDTLQPQQEEEEENPLREFVEALPVLSPQAISDELEVLGYKGQDEQRRALALMAYRHVRRLKRLHVEGESYRDLPPKQNVLMVGPTGCGKTFLVELLFQNIFKLPTVVVDVTSFTESGYVGDDVRTILTRLIAAAGEDARLASCGVVCLDEFDKLASSSSSARFAGQGTTKDVSGYGVQRELLAMLDGTQVMAPMDYGFSAYGHRLEISTRNIPFIACGAFSGFDDVLKSKHAGIGFLGADDLEAQELSIEQAESFQRYGFMPELIGRFSRVVVFPVLPADTLKRILVDNVLPQFRNEFRGEGLQLTVTEEALSHIVARAHRRGTGARGLHTELVTAVERAAFETFMRTTNAEVVITVTDGRLRSEVHKLA